MENGVNWKPAIGQKIVALISAGRIVKGDVYTACHVYQCKCGTYHVEVSELKASMGTSNNFCLDCKSMIDCETDNASMRSCRFAPIQIQYTDITKEIADSVGITEEVPDVKKIKELETSN